MTEVMERIPFERLELLSRMTLDDYVRFSNKTKYKITEIKEHFLCIQAYIRNHIQCKGVMKKVYKYSEQFENGRLYGVHSIQNLDGIIRGFLFGTTTTDFDMKNAHPHILEYICRVRDIRCPCLTEYIHNRDAIVHKLNMVGVKDPKFEILKMLNTEKLTRISNDCENILKNLRDEFKTIRGRLKQEQDFVEQLQHAMIYKPSNVEGSFVNRILCIYENKIMQAMASYIHSKQLEIAEYAFDGILVYGQFYDRPEMLSDMQAYVNETFPNLNMTLTMKPHSQVITAEYLEHLEEPVFVAEEETYAYMKKEFERTHCKIVQKSMFINEYNHKPCFMNRKQLMDAYEHMNYKDKDGKKLPFLVAWLKDEEIRLYTDVDTFPPPLVCPKDIYNLWIPFEMEFITEWEEKDVSVFLNHIKILCNHEEETYDYFIKWIAQMIQYPAVKTTMILFQGAEGCGKGRLFSIIEKLIGSSKYFETSCPERDVWGHFNPRMSNSFFVHLSELSKKQTMDSENKIKALVTDPAIEINQKGKDTISTTSYHRFVVASNDDEPMNTHKGDRRKLLISSSNELKGQSDYFKTLSECIEDVNYIKSFYEYLKAIPDMHSFGRIPIPMTEYQKLLCELSITPIEAFIKDMVSDCTRPELVYTSKELFDKFQDYLVQSKTKYDINIIKFGVRLNNLKLNGVETVKGKLNNSKRFDIPILKKHFGIACLL